MNDPGFRWGQSIRVRGDVPAEFRPGQAVGVLASLSDQDDAEAPLEIEYLDGGDRTQIPRRWLERVDTRGWFSALGYSIGAEERRGEYVADFSRERGSTVRNYGSGATPEAAIESARVDASSSSRSDRRLNGDPPGRFPSNESRRLLDARLTRLPVRYTSAGSALRAEPAWSGARTGVPGLLGGSAATWDMPARREVTSRRPRGQSIIDDVWRELIAGLSPDAQLRGSSRRVRPDRGDGCSWRGVAQPARFSPTCTNGVEGEYGLGVIWPLERIVDDNVRFRNDAQFRGLYEPFDPLLFFADGGNGDQFALDGHRAATKCSCGITKTTVGVWWLRISSNSYASGLTGRSRSRAGRTSARTLPVSRLQRHGRARGGRGRRSMSCGCSSGGDDPARPSSGRRPMRARCRGSAASRAGGCGRGRASCGGAPTACRSGRGATALGPPDRVRTRTSRRRTRCRTRARSRSLVTRNRWSVATVSSSIGQPRVRVRLRSLLEDLLRIALHRRESSVHVDVAVCRDRCHTSAARLSRRASCREQPKGEGTRAAPRRTLGQPEERAQSPRAPVPASPSERLWERARGRAGSPAASPSARPSTGSPRAACGSCAR